MSPISNTGSVRTRLAAVLLAGVAAVALVAAGAATPASAAESGSLKGLVLSGSCPSPSGDLKNVTVAPRSDILWLPVRFSTSEGTALRKWILPYEVTVVGDGLKSRHLLPGVTYTRPFGPPIRPTTCFFEGATKEDGPFTVEMTGTIVGSGALLGY